MKRQIQKFTRGSILAYSLILLGIVLVASIGMMSASVTNLRSVSSSNESVNAFQIADSGAQAVIASIKRDGSGTIENLASRMGLSCDNSSGSVTGSILGGKEYRITFLGGSPQTSLRCNDNVYEVSSLKSVGTYSNTARAVQVAVAGASNPGVTGGCAVTTANLITGKWGAGCLPNNDPAVGCGAASDGPSGYECGLVSVIGSEIPARQGERICLCTHKD